MKNSSSNRKGIKIGPDAMRFKCLDDELVKQLPICVEGVIFDVGIDFVEVLQFDHRIVTVKTDRITHVKWPDQIGREAVSSIKHDGKCRCVEFNRVPNNFEEREKRGNHMKKNMRQNKKGKKIVKADPHHCPHCGNYHSRLNPCRCKQDHWHHHQRPCGCKSNRVNHYQRLCDCREQHGNFKRPCGCREQHENFKRHCGCHEHVNHQGPCGCKERHGNHHHKPCGCHDHQVRHHQCPHCLDEHHKRHHSCQPMHHHDCCHKNFACFCDFAIPFCDHRFELRLAGLNDNLNFKLLENKGRHVEMIVE